MQTFLHGFLNVFVAGVLADARALDEKQVRAVIADEDAANFVFDESGLCWKDWQATTAQIASARAVLVTSFGSFDVGFSARHLAVNALTALATAQVLGLELPGRIEATFAEWRNQELELPGGGLLINDAWNAHPISMRAALEHLADRAGDRRRVAVLGQMAELGEYADEAHLEVARAVEQIGVDVLIAVGPEARVYGGRQAADATEAIEALREELQPGDCVLVKGARVLELEKVAEALAAVHH